MRCHRIEPANSAKRKTKRERKGTTLTKHFRNRLLGGLGTAAAVSAVACFLPFHAFGASPLLERLNSNEPADEIAAEKGICAKLHDICFPDVERTLANLGADDYETREHATRILIRIGESVRKTVADLKKKTKDPEVKTRCARILDALQKNNDAAAGRDPVLEKAMEIALLSKENPKTNQAFLSLYFEKYNALPKRLRILLPVAFEKAKHWKNTEKLLFSLLTAMRREHDDQAYQMMENGLRKILPTEKFKIISRKVRAWREIDKMDLQKRGEMYMSGNMRDGMNFINIREAIRRIDGFYLIKHDVIREYAEADDPYMAGVASFLVGEEDTLPYKDEMLGIMKRNLGGKFEWCFFEWGLLGVHNRPEMFGDSVKMFLDSEDYHLYGYGLTCVIEPKKYGERLMGDAFNGSTAAMRFISERLPEMKKKMLSEAVDQIRVALARKGDSKISVPGKLFSMLEVFGYRGHVFDAWFEKRVLTNPTDFNGKNVNFFRMLNIPPDLLMKHLDVLELNTSMRPKDVTYLLSCSEKTNREKALGFILEGIRKDLDSWIPWSNVGLLIQAVPEKAPEMLDAVFQALSPKIGAKLYWAGLPKQLPPLAAAIDAEDGKTLEVVEKYLGADSFPARRLVAAMLLARSSTPDAKSKGIATMVELVPWIDKKLPDAVLPCLFILQKNRDVPDSAVTAFSAYLLKNALKNWNQWCAWKYRQAFRGFKGRPAVAKVLWNKLMAFEKNTPTPKPNHAARGEMPENLLFAVLGAVVDADPTFQPAVDRLEKIIEGEGGIYDAYSALAILSRNGVKIKFPPERLDLLEPCEKNLQCAVLALDANEENLAAALPYFKRHVAGGVPSPMLLADAMTRHPALRRALLPELVAHLEKHKDSRGASAVFARFPAAIQPRIARCFANAGTKEEIRNLAWLTIRIAKPSAEIAETAKGFLEKADSAREKESLIALLAKTDPDKGKRREYASSFIELLDNRPFSTEFAEALDSAAALFEFPDILAPFMEKQFRSEDFRKQLAAAKALAKQTPPSKFAIDRLLAIVDDYAKGKNAALFFGALRAVTAAGNSELAAAISPVLQRIPPPKEKRWKFDKIKEAIAEQAAKIPE